MKLKSSINKYLFCLKTSLPLQKYSIPDKIVKITPMYNKICPIDKPINVANGSPNNNQVIATIVTAVLILPN